MIVFDATSRAKVELILRDCMLATGTMVVIPKISAVWMAEGLLQCMQMIQSQADAEAGTPVLLPSNVIPFPKKPSPKN